MRCRVTARIFYLLAGIALASHWIFHWETFAKAMGWLLITALIIKGFPRAASGEGDSERTLDHRLQIVVVLGTAALLIPILLFPTTTGFSEGNAFFAKPYEAIKQSVLLFHRFPLWDASSGGGESILADPVAAQFYPPMWLTFLAPTAHTALWWIVYLHLIAAALGSYTLARWIGCRPIAALLAPLGFVFNSYVASMLVNGGLPILYAFTWLVWGTALLWRGATADSIGFLVGAGACLAAQVLAGTGYDINFSILLYGLLLVFAAVSSARPWHRKMLQCCRQTAIVFGCAIGFSAVKLMPVLEFLAISNRSGFSLADVAAQPPPSWQDLGGLLFSRFFEVIPGWGAGARWMTWVYTFFILSALWSWYRRGPLWRPTVFFTVVLAVACGITLGTQAPINLLALVYYLIPGFRQSAHVPRVLIIARLAIPILAAIGASALLHHASTRTSRFRQLPQQAVLALVAAFVPLVYAPFMAHVSRYSAYGYVERVRTGFLAVLAEMPRVRVESSPPLFQATVLLKNVGDEPWRPGTEIGWRLNGTLFHISAITQRVAPGEATLLQVQKLLSGALTVAPHIDVRLSRGPEEEGLRLALLERLPTGAYQVNTTPTTVETILNGRGLLGQRPADWNALLGTLSRWHAPEGVRVSSDFGGVYPYTALLHGFQVDSYTNSTVRPRYLWPLRWEPDGARGPRMLRVMNVRYLLLPANHTTRVGADQARLLKAGSDAHLYELASALPRAWCPAAAALLIGNDRDVDAVDAKLLVYHPTFNPASWAVFRRQVSCVDDLVLEELAPFSALVLINPEVRDPRKAKALLEAYRQSGGRVIHLPVAAYRYVSSRDIAGSMLDGGLPAIALGTETATAVSELFATVPRHDLETPSVVMEEETLSYRRLRVETGRDATPLIVSEISFPGWHAAVDGRRAPLYMADGLIRGVMVRGKGRHTVEFWYNPSTLWWGATATVASLIWVVMCWIRWKRRVA